MWFMIEHEHDPRDCPAGYEEKLGETLEALVNEGHAKDSGVEVHGSYIAGPEHRFFFVAETDDYKKIVKFLEPVQRMGKAHITPIAPHWHGGRRF